MSCPSVGRDRYECRRTSMVTTSPVTMLHYYRYAICSLAVYQKLLCRVVVGRNVLLNVAVRSVMSHCVTSQTGLYCHMSSCMISRYGVWKYAVWRFDILRNRFCGEY